MNERNVEALKDLLGAAVLANHDREGDLSFEFLAKWLAACGVLVPSALTDGDLFDLLHGLQYTNVEREDRNSVRTDLERIAKGEPVSA